MFLANAGALSYVANGGSKLIAASFFDKLPIKKVLGGILLL